jgi:hypothetical protein
VRMGASTRSSTGPTRGPRSKRRTSRPSSRPDEFTTAGAARFRPFFYPRDRPVRRGHPTRWSFTSPAACM